jgi:protein-tyrosine phosphatase
MRGFVDLHCHWVAGIDDGARTPEDSVAMLTALRRAGFDTVVATPHMRPGMFDNTAKDLTAAYEATRTAIAAAPDLPEMMLSSEHFFDGTVFSRIVEGAALPYPGGHAVLVEFPTQMFPTNVAHRFFDMRRKRIRPVLAHPERYEPVWREIEILEPLLDGGALMLLDVAALVGKYGRKPKHVAEELLEAGFYYAACSDAHKASDVEDVAKGIKRLYDILGDEDATFMMADGPRSILTGNIEE